MLILKLPNLVAGRELADQMLDRFDASFEQQVVVVDARATAGGSPSFASQLVRRTLVVGRAHSLVVVGGPTRFVEHITESASQESVAGRVAIAKDFPGAPGIT